jgi:hypothetical protein
MAHINKVLRSIEAPDRSRCVDVFVRPDGPFGFEEYLRESEDERCWFPAAFHGARPHANDEAALDDALAHVAWAVNMGCLGFHVWPSRADTPERTDELRIDLGDGFALQDDPGALGDEARSFETSLAANMQRQGMSPATTVSTPALSKAFPTRFATALCPPSRGPSATSPMPVQATLPGSVRRAP